MSDVATLLPADQEEFEAVRSRGAGVHVVKADFDLCCDCYSGGKFDASMSQTDCILMESAEVEGSGGTSWIDQETLLLLEGLEIFQAKWSACWNKIQSTVHATLPPNANSGLLSRWANVSGNCRGGLRRKRHISCSLENGRSR